MINSTSVIIPVGLLVAPFALFLSSCVFLEYMYTSYDVWLETLGLHNALLRGSIGKSRRRSIKVVLGWLRRNLWSLWDTCNAAQRLVEAMCIPQAAQQHPKGGAASERRMISCIAIARAPDSPLCRLQRAEITIHGHFPGLISTPCMQFHARRVRGG